MQPIKKGVQSTVVMENGINIGIAPVVELTSQRVNGPEARRPRIPRICSHRGEITTTQVLIPLDTAPVNFPPITMAAKMDSLRTGDYRPLHDQIGQFLNETGHRVEETNIQPQTKKITDLIRSKIPQVPKYFKVT